MNHTCRVLPPIYEDGVGQPLGFNSGRLYNNNTLPLVRDVSNRLAHVAEGDVVSDDVLTHLITVWGQYVDHDMGLTPQSKSISAFQGNVRCDQTCQNLNPCFPIQLPADDVLRERGRNCLPFFRSASTCGTGNIANGMFQSLLSREQLNAVTSYIDASTVYGSDAKNQHELRDPTNPQFLLVNDQYRDTNNQAFLPFTADKCVQEVNSTEPDVPCFKAGDGRAPEVAPLSAIHTVWMRYHNYLVEQLTVINGHWSAEQLYQQARKIVSSLHQKISFYDYLPHILGPDGASALGLDII